MVHWALQWNTWPMCLTELQISPKSPILSLVIFLFLFPPSLFYYLRIPLPKSEGHYKFKDEATLAIKNKKGLSHNTTLTWTPSTCGRKSREGGLCYPPLTLSSQTLSSAHRNSLVTTMLSSRTIVFKCANGAVVIGNLRICLLALPIEPVDVFDPLHTAVMFVSNATKDIL